MKFAIITDIHLGPNALYKGKVRKISDNVKEHVNDFVEKMNTEYKPEFVVTLGDQIQDEDEENDKKNMSDIIGMLGKLNSPVYFAAGNHDLKNISEQELADFFKQKRLFYAFDCGDYHGVVLYSKVVEKENIQITMEQIDWLKKELEHSKKDCVVFVHHALADQDLSGNPWFEEKPNACLVRNREEVRKILEDSGKVVAVFNSHLHWDRMHVHNNIPYFTLQSLVENEDDKGLPSEAYFLINVEKRKTVVEVKGNYPKKFEYLKT